MQGQLLAQQKVGANQSQQVVHALYLPRLTPSKIGPATAERAVEPGGSFPVTYSEIKHAQGEV